MFMCSALALLLAWALEQQCSDLNSLTTFQPADYAALLQSTPKNGTVRVPVSGARDHARVSAGRKERQSASTLLRGYVAAVFLRLPRLIPTLRIRGVQVRRRYTVYSDSVL